MKNSLMSLLLLVIINTNLTHANTLNKILKNKIDDGDDDVRMRVQENSLLETQSPFKVRKSRILKRNAFGSGRSSVVQDWNLVCKELCGTGLGGPNCEPQCKIPSDSLTMNQTSQVDQMLSENKDNICFILCTSGLGNPMCKCIKAIINGKTKASLEYNSICSSFCDYNNITLSGCSPCLQPSLVNNIHPDPYPKLFDNLAKTMTIRSTTAYKSGTTTPNWEKLCIQLCKTGDGGALCNCDLPPFF